MARISIRLDLAPGCRIGPGKIALLEQIASSGSISGAGRAMGMSYRRAWLLVEELNRLFKEPVVTAHPGGARGGGTALTAFGESVVTLYRDIERSAQAEAQARLDTLSAALSPPLAQAAANGVLDDA
jgi:molybdate transport system regulatory protein